MTFIQEDLPTYLKTHCKFAVFLRHPLFLLFELIHHQKGGSFEYWKQPFWVDSTKIQEQKKSSSTAQNRKRKPPGARKLQLKKKTLRGRTPHVISLFFPLARRWRLRRDVKIIAKSHSLIPKDVISKKKRNTTSERKDQKQERFQRSCLPLRVFETRVSLLLPSDRETQQDLCIWSRKKIRRGILNGWKDIWKRCFIKDFVYFAAQYEHVKFLGFYHWKKICVSRCFRSSAVWKNFLNRLLPLIPTQVQPSGGGMVFCYPS